MRPMTRAFRPVTRAVLIEELVARLDAAPVPGAALRVGIDGADATDPRAVAAELVAPLRERGRSVSVIDARTFWRDASLRFEHGREDVDSYLDWLDAAALHREVLAPLGPGGTGRFVPSLRDVATNRATRERALDA